ncbi:MAG TPA: hypothetical protein VKF61_10160 [Candidatus Polarisedimenticolia bacterium]|nr:hypothetical protein [Candidatus Polarisedimenticolia bacterium]
MRRGTDRKTVIRLAGIALSLAGLAIGATAFLRFVTSVAHNSLAGGPSLARIPEYYRQVGAYYARGFVTGFFVCYFLMLLAMIVGAWVDEARQARRARRGAESAPAPAAPVSPALVGDPVRPD